MARERRALYPPVLSPRSRPSCPASGVQEPAARVSNPTLTLIGPFGGLLPPFRALGRVIGANGADRAAQDALASAQCPYRHGYQIFRGRNEPASQQLGWVVGPFRSFPVRLPPFAVPLLQKDFPPPLRLARLLPFSFSLRLLQLPPPPPAHPRSNLGPSSHHREEAAKKKEDGKCCCSICIRLAIYHRVSSWICIASFKRLSMVWVSNVPALF